MGAHQRHGESALGSRQEKGYWTSVICHLSFVILAKHGDQVEIQVAGRTAFEVSKAPGRRELVVRLRKFRGRLPATFRFDRLEANERG